MMRIFIIIFGSEVIKLITVIFFLNIKLKKKVIETEKKLCT